MYSIAPHTVVVNHFLTFYNNSTAGRCSEKSTTTVFWMTGYCAIKSDAVWKSVKKNDLERSKSTTANILPSFAVTLYKHYSTSSSTCQPLFASLISIKFFQQRKVSKNVLFHSVGLMLSERKVFVSVNIVLFTAKGTKRFAHPSGPRLQFIWSGVFVIHSHTLGCFSTATSPARAVRTRPRPLLHKQQSFSQYHNGIPAVHQSDHHLPRSCVGSPHRMRSCHHWSSIQNSCRCPSLRTVRLDLWCKCSKPSAPLNCLTVIYSIQSPQPLVNHFLTPHEQKD